MSAKVEPERGYSEIMESFWEVWFLIVRVYRGKRRVVAMLPTKPEAEHAFEQYSAALRDGDLILYRSVMAKQRTTSGGYNRTRW